MRAVSPKRAKQLRVYSKLRAEFLAVDRFCEFPLGCDEIATVVHHRRGRAGERLVLTEWWAASCDFHNDYAETQTGHSLEIGWLVRIEGAA